MTIEEWKQQISDLNSKINPEKKKDKEQEEMQEVQDLINKMFCNE